MAKIQEHLNAFVRTVRLQTVIPLPDLQARAAHAQRQQTGNEQAHQDERLKQASLIPHSLTEEELNPFGRPRVDRSSAALASSPESCAAAQPEQVMSDDARSDQADHSVMFAQQPNCVGIGTYTPMVGLIVSLVTIIILRLIEYLSHAFSGRFPVMNFTLIEAVFALVIIGLLTRFMHFDALADMADAWWGGYTKKDRLRIMSDTKIGSFGVSALILYALMFVVLASTFLGTTRLFWLVPIMVIARISTFVAGWLSHPAKPGGLGRSNFHEPGVDEIVVVAFTLIISCMIGFYYTPLTVHLLPVLILGFASACAIPMLCAKRFGGMTGDVFGASLVLSELVIMALFVLLI